jgi:hypothetical protein
LWSTWFWPFLAGALSVSAFWTLSIFRAVNTPPLAVDIVSVAGGQKNLRITNTSDEFLTIGVATPFKRQHRGPPVTCELPPGGTTQVANGNPGMPVGTLVEIRAKGYSGCIRLILH